MEERMGYALENLGRDWSNVIFSDEKTYQTDRHQKLHVYRPKNTRYDPRYIKDCQRSGRISAGYWGWISREGPGELVAIGGRLNSAGYVEILNVLKPTVDLALGDMDKRVFMQVSKNRLFTTNLLNNTAKRILLDSQKQLITNALHIEWHFLFDKFALRFGYILLLIEYSG